MESFKLDANARDTAKKAMSEPKKIIINTASLSSKQPTKDRETATAKTVEESKKCTQIIANDDKNIPVNRLKLFDKFAMTKQKRERYLLFVAKLFQL